MATIQPPPPPPRTGETRVDAYLEQIYKWQYLMWYYLTNSGSAAGDGALQNIQIPGLDGEPGEDGFTIIDTQGPQGIPGLTIPGMDGQDADEQIVVLNNVDERLARYNRTLIWLTT